MSPDIKFTPTGIPYILEFQNVSVVPDHTQQPSPSSSSSSFCLIDLPPPPPRRPPLFKRRNAHTPTPDVTKPLPPPPKPEPVPHGIFIQFPPERAYPQMTRKQRLVHLQQTISMAVRDAGMRCSPGNIALPENDQAHLTQGHKSANALFCGTYGQMMTALEGAGLSATPCTGESLSVRGYSFLAATIRHVHKSTFADTRLGALFVARNDGASGVQLRKITLWG